MSDDDVKGFTVNNKTVSFIMGLITLSSMVAGGVTMVNGYSFRIDQLEKRNVELLSEVGRLKTTIDALNEKMVTLTISLERMQERERVKEQ